LNNIPKPEIYKEFNLARLKNETRKKSLTKDQLKALIAYDPPSEAQKQAKLLFLFSFYARGINLMDMLQLTGENIESNTLLYRRQKTGKQLRIKLIKEAQLILEYFKNDSGFLFPYLKKGQVPKFRVRDVNANINRRLKLIGKIIGVEELSMIYSRHSFAELNYKAGVRIEIISQMLGHSNSLITKTYLKRFSDDEVDQAASTIFDSI
jgi:integrase